MRDDFSRRYDKIQGGQMKVVHFQQDDQYYRISPATGAGHVNGVDNEFDPAFEPTAHGVTVDMIKRPFVTGTCPVTTIPFAPVTVTRLLQAAADMLRERKDVSGMNMAGWLEELAASVDAPDPFAVDYAALAAEEQRSQYQDAADAAGYPPEF